MIWHPRADWVGAEPVTGPAIRWADFDTVVAHYTAAPNLIDGDPGEQWGLLPQYLRSIHHDYLHNRPQPDGSPGYSIGYCVAVDARGEAWELRGFDIKPAATKGHNDHAWPILLLVDGQDAATPEAVETVRELVTRAQGQAGRPLAIRGHRDFAATQCPGDGVYGQVQDGTFRPRLVVADPPPVHTSTPDLDPTTVSKPSMEDDDMPKPEMRRFVGYKNVFHFEAGQYSHGTKVTVERAIARGDELVVVDAHPQGLKSALAQSGFLTSVDLIPTDDGK